MNKINKTPILLHIPRYNIVSDWLCEKIESEENSFSVGTLNVDSKNTNFMHKLILAEYFSFSSSPTSFACLFINARSSLIGGCL